MATVPIRDILDNETGEPVFPRTHVKAVIGLADSNFFEEYVDGNGARSVKLRSDYVGLWVEGWIANGGVGSGGGGGGASFLNDLEDVDAPNPSDGDLLSWDGEAWVNIPQSTISPDLSGYGHALSLTNNAATFFKDSNGNFLLDSNGRFLVNGASASINLLNGSGSVISSVNIPVASLDLSDYATKSWVQGQNYVTASALSGYVTETALGSWTGSTNITTLGTISSGSIPLSLVTGANDLKAIEALAGTAGLLKKTAENTWALDTNPYVYEVDTQGDGFLDFVHADGNITRIDLNHEHSNYVPITRTVNGTPLSQDISITAQGLGVASWAMGSGSGSTVPFEVLPDLYALGTKVTDAPGLGILLGVSVMSANLASSAGNDTSRVQWDHVNDAWHFYGNVYVDGFLAGGGIGSGGGGGYGVEEITSNQDGTVDFHFTGGDVTTVDLNHEHPQYAKKVVCTQVEYDAITTKDDDTLYLIPETSA